MVHFYALISFVVLLCLSFAVYLLVSWYGVNKRMWQLCFRVGLLARGGRPGLKRALETHPLKHFFSGRLQLELDREIARLERDNRIRARRNRNYLTLWPAEMLRHMTERVDRIEKALVS